MIGLTLLTADEVCVCCPCESCGLRYHGRAVGLPGNMFGRELVLVELNISEVGDVVMVTLDCVRPVGDRCDSNCRSDED